MSTKKSLILLFLLTLILSCTTTAVKETVLLIPEKTLYEQNIEKAENGDLDAQVLIGISFEEGKDVEVNYDEAYKWYKSAASGGNNEAYFRIGRFYELGHSVEKNPADAHEWYLSSGITGYTPAIVKLIKYYEFDEIEQMKWIELGVINKDPYSYFQLALKIERSQPELAIEYFIKAVNLNDIDIKGILSILSLGSDSSFYNENESLDNIRIAAESGNIRCILFSGWLNEFGYSVNKDYAKAFELYKRAAESNDNLALYNLSRFYGEGLSVEQDPTLANMYFKKIEEDYYSTSLTDLKKFALKGEFTDQLLVLYRFEAAFKDLNALYQLGLLSEPAESAQWFWLAAESGHIDSMRELAHLFLDQDIVRATAWLMMAENLSGITDALFSSSSLLEQMDDEQKLETSILFTEMFYSEDRKIDESPFLR